jgi:hypothetical protein
MAGIGGAAVGGWVSYHGNRSLEAGASRSAARGIARVYQGEFLDFDSRLSVMLSSNRYIAPTNYPFDLSLDDKKTLAANMDAQDWYVVEDTEAALRLFDNPDDIVVKKAAAGLSPPLDRPHRRYVQANHEAAKRAIAALAPLAGINPNNPSP